MIKTITVAGAALLLSSAVAWAQVPGGVVAPVTTPQTTGATTQGMSDAAKGAAADAKGAAADAKGGMTDTKTVPAPAPDKK